MSNFMTDFTTLTNQLNAITQAVNNLNNTLNTLLPNGAFHPISASDSSQTTNSVYYSTTQDLLVYKDSNSVANPLYYNTLNGSATFHPGALLTMTGATSSGITVTGAALGNYVEVSAPYDLQGTLATAYVSASNTVTITVYNWTFGTVTLVSGTWKVRVSQ